MIERAHAMTEDQIKTALAIAYGAGYSAGHHDTVEGGFRDVQYRERAREFDDVAAELFADLIGDSDV